MRMDLTEVERDDSGAALCWGPVEPDVRNFRQAAQCVRGELVLVSLDCLESDRLEIVDRKAGAVRLGNGRRARLEFMRQLAPGGLVDADGIDHVSAEQERFHRAQQLSASPERS